MLHLVNRVRPDIERDWLLGAVQCREADHEPSTGVQGGSVPGSVEVSYDSVVAAVDGDVHVVRGLAYDIVSHPLSVVLMVEVQTQRLGVHIQVEVLGECQ